MDKYVMRRDYAATVQRMKVGQVLELPMTGTASEALRQACSQAARRGLGKWTCSRNMERSIVTVTRTE